MQHADVSFATKQAVVRYAAGKIGVADMLAAIKRIGFAASPHEWASLGGLRVSKQVFPWRLQSFARLDE